MKTSRQAFLNLSAELLVLLKKKRPEIEALLLNYEPYETVKDELERSIATLEGLEDELADLQSDVDDITIATFMPLNLPLYSLILFAIVPSVFAGRLYVRAPALTQEVLAKLSDLLELKIKYPNILIKQIPSALFIQLYGSHADVILFTGRYENAQKIQASCPHALLVYNGSGINPVIVFKNAIAQNAADKVYEMRTFNSGQDCAGSDVIFVHEHVLEPFLNRLQSKLTQTVVGEYGTPSVQVGPIHRKEYVTKLADYLAAEVAHIAHGGHIDRGRSIAHPTIILKNITEHSGAFHEFFAPVFYILVYNDEIQLTKILNNSVVSDYSMYISHFGEHPITRQFTKANLLHDQIVNDIEKGNCEYGGYGKRANFLAFSSQQVSQPILISRDIDSFYANDGLVANAKHTP